MQKSFFFIFLLCFFLTIESSCRAKNNFPSLDSWAGKYDYGEEPIEAIAGYHMVMIWELAISKDDESSKATLEVNGQQTYFKLLGTVLGDTNTIAITYDKLIDGLEENLKKGDTLFTLSKTGDKLMTKWFALEPRLAKDPPKECDCFTLRKTKRKQ